MAEYSNWDYLRRVEYFKKLYEKKLQKETNNIHKERSEFVASDF